MDETGKLAGTDDKTNIPIFNIIGSITGDNDDSSLPTLKSAYLVYLAL